MIKFNSIAKHVVFISSGNKVRLDAFAQICHDIGFDDVIPIDGAFIQSRLPHDCACKKDHFNKLLAFNQTDKGFDKVVLIDTDVFAVNNFDDLFKYKPVGMARRGWPAEIPNSGVLLLKPQKKLFEQMAAALPEISSSDTPLREGPANEKYNYGDQAFIRQFLKVRGSPEHTLNELPAKFNTWVKNIDAYDDAVDIIHFCGGYAPYKDVKLISGLNSTSKIAKHMCEFIAAAHATLKRHPTIRANKLFGHLFEDWGTLVGQPQVVYWATRACPQLPGLPRLKSGTSLHNFSESERDMDFATIRDLFTAALSGRQHSYDGRRMIRSLRRRGGDGFRLEP